MTINFDTRVWVNLPKVCYGFVNGSKETTKRTGFVNSGESIFISISGDLEIQKLMYQLQEANKSVSFFFIRVGWINDQFINNRITVEVKVINKKPSMS